MVFPVNFWILFAVAVVICLPEIKIKNWIVYYGGHLATAALGLTLLLLYQPSVVTGAFSACLLLILYGCLATISSCQLGRKNESADSRGVAYFIASFLVNLLFSAIYLLPVAPILYSLHNGSAANLWMWIGVVLMIVGVILKLSDMFFRRFEFAIIDGLTRLFERITKRTTCFYMFQLAPFVFWTGVLIIAVGGVSGIGQWIVVLLGYAAVLKFHLL